MTRSTKNHGTVLITGASAGIGRELALEFGARAEMLVLVARRLDRLEALKAELAARYPGCRLSCWRRICRTRATSRRCLAESPGRRVQSMCW